VSQTRLVVEDQYVSIRSGLSNTFCHQGGCLAKQVSFIGAGQTFRLQTGNNFLSSDYLPKFYVPPKLEIGSVTQVGGVKPRRGLEINAETGDLDSIPLSSDLISSMNTSHFTNNTQTGKIDFNTSFIPATSTSTNLITILNSNEFENANYLINNKSKAISKITNLHTNLDLQVILIL
jgi:hypothetical protein